MVNGGSNAIDRRYPKCKMLGKNGSSKMAQFCQKRPTLPSTGVSTTWTFGSGRTQSGLSGGSLFPLPVPKPAVELATVELIGVLMFPFPL